MYVLMYACMLVCVHVFNNSWMYACMHVCVCTDFGGLRCVLITRCLMTETNHIIHSTSLWRLGRKTKRCRETISTSKHSSRAHWAPQQAPVKPQVLLQALCMTPWNVGSAEITPQNALRERTLHRHCTHQGISP